MAFKYFILAVLIGVAASQEGSGIADSGVRSCYTGEGNSEESIETEITGCRFLENSCQAKVEVGAQGMRVYGECKELAACKSNAEANKRNCYSILETRDQAARIEQVCHFCCQGHLCNDAEFIDRSLQTRKDRLIVE